MFWAVIGCRVVGGLLLLPGMAGVVNSGAALVNPRFAAMVAILLAAGAAYLVLAHRLARGHAWAGICGIVLACLTLLVLLAVVAIEWALLWLFYGRSAVPSSVVIAFAVEAMILIGLVWLTVQLWRSVRAIQRDRAENGHGFAVLPVAAVPIQPGDEP